MSEELIIKLQNLGLSEEKSIETAKNKKLNKNFQLIVQLLDSDKMDKSLGVLFYTLASKPINEKCLKFNIDKITSKELDSNDKVLASISFCEKITDPNLINNDEFKKQCGIGIEVTEKEINEVIDIVIKQNEAKLKTDRYKFVGILLSKVKADEKMKWANGGKVKEALDAKILEMIGPKDERDVPQKKEKKKEVLKEDKKEDLMKIFSEGELSKLHKAGDNPQIDDELIKIHLQQTGGKVITRFPPEPNGYLHIGHAKAININFGYAKYHKGECYLRYDDTNPEAEEETYFNSIKDIVLWLGFEPKKITYSSDYFDQLFDLAVKLIEVDKAYICHCTGEEIYQHRGGDSQGPRTECSHRNRPIEESKKEFFKMKNGLYEEGKAILRMKQDLTNGNPQFWDLVAYRIIYLPHHRTLNKWCIYPTYDFTHCLVDSFENITHSLCTTEFRQSRESYYWLCDELKVYKPVQWEYGRLSVEGTITSKRKLAQLVKENKVNDWDDPRLFTLIALKRRGVPPEAINSFVSNLGVTTSNSVIEQSRFDNVVRDVLNSSAIRLMACLNPIQINLINLDESYESLIEIPFLPKDLSKGSRKVPFTNTVFIDESDFRLEDDPNFYRLAPGKSIGLLNVPNPITLIDYIRENDKLILNCRYEDENFPKPKTYIQWVAKSSKYKSPVTIDAHCFSQLFFHSNPLDKNLVPNGFLSDVNSDSLQKYNAIIEVGIWNIIYDLIIKKQLKDQYEQVRIQFIRLAYFALDKLSILPNQIELLNDISVVNEKFHLIFNRIVTLKEDSKKN